MQLFLHSRSRESRQLIESRRENTNTEMYEKVKSLERTKHILQWLLLQEDAVSGNCHQRLIEAIFYSCFLDGFIIIMIVQVMLHQKTRPLFCDILSNIFYYIQNSLLK